VREGSPPSPNATVIRVLKLSTCVWCSTDFFHDQTACKLRCTYVRTKDCICLSNLILASVFPSRSSRHLSQICEWRWHSLRQSRDGSHVACLYSASTCLHSRNHVRHMSDITLELHAGLRLFSMIFAICPSNEKPAGPSEASIQGESAFKRRENWLPPVRQQ
jgi:hypothetical protein